MEKNHAIIFLPSLLCTPMYLSTPEISLVYNRNFFQIRLTIAPSYLKRVLLSVARM